MRTIPAFVVILSIMSIPAIAQKKASKPDIGAMIKAAEQGDVEAQIKLSNEYMTGKNIAQNTLEAIKWRIKAADQGNQAAQIGLGWYYAFGELGTGKDYVQAYKWLELASDPSLHNMNLNPSGKDRIKGNLDRIIKKMTSAQITEAKRLISEWKLNHPQLTSVPDHTPPIPIVRPAPSYTEEARNAGIKGIVSMECMVRKSGMVDDCKILNSLGHGLDEVAIQMVTTKWRFKPATDKGKAKDVKTTIEISFRPSTPK
jgi:TonB family protein